MITTLCSIRLCLERQLENGDFVTSDRGSSWKSVVRGYLRTTRECRRTRIVIKRVSLRGASAEGLNCIDISVNTNTFTAAATPISCRYNWNSRFRGDGWNTLEVLTTTIIILCTNNTAAAADIVIVDANGGGGVVMYKPLSGRTVFNDGENNP